MQKRSAITRRFKRGEAGLSDQQKINEIDEIAKVLKKDIEDTKPAKRSALDFFNKATNDYADGNINGDVYAAIDTLYRQYPFVLEGLKLSIPKKERDSKTGEYEPAERIVRLFKGTVGVTDPVTIRHEITHSLEQMMPADAAADLVMDWSDKLGKAIKRAKSPEARDYFQAILEFFENQIGRAHV